MGDGTGGDGFSFSYGLVPPSSAVGADGVSTGLCVRFVTRDAAQAPVHAVELLYDGTLLQSIDLRRAQGAGSGADGSSAGVASLREHAWVPVSISYDSVGLAVVLGGRAVYDGIDVPGWEPTAEWSFALGASTSAWTDAHLLDKLAIRLGATVSRVSVPVEVTANGQQFSGSGVPFDYFPQPTVSHVLPSAGPLDGGTLVGVSGSGLLGAPGLLRCRFDEAVVPASYAHEAVRVGLVSLPRGSLLCAAPPVATPAVALVSLTLNDQDYTPSSAPFTYYAAPRVSRLSPLVGPARGGTSVRVYGAHLTGGENRTRFCRFGHLPVVPAVVVSESSLVCVTPRVPSGVEGPVSFELTLNLQNFTTDETNFTYHAPVAVSQLSPSTGPAAGGSLIALTGAFSDLGSTYNCSFAPNEPLLPATRLSHETLLCASTPLAVGNYYLSVTLNGVDFSEDTPADEDDDEGGGGGGGGMSRADTVPAFTVYQTPLLLRLSPNSGPLSGDTLVSISGSGFASGSARFCSFRGAPIHLHIYMAPMLRILRSHLL